MLTRSVPGKLIFDNLQILAIYADISVVSLSSHQDDFVKSTRQPTGRRRRCRISLVASGRLCQVHPTTNRTPTSLSYLSLPALFIPVYMRSHQRNSDVSVQAVSTSSYPFYLHRNESNASYTCLSNCHRNYYYRTQVQLQQHHDRGIGNFDTSVSP